MGQLHHSLLATSANSPRVAAALLHRERSQQNGGDCNSEVRKISPLRRGVLTAVAVGVPLENFDVVSARMERAVWLPDRLVEIDDDDILHGDERRAPAAIIHSACQPIEAAVRPAGGSDLPYQAKICQSN